MFSFYRRNKSTLFYKNDYDNLVKYVRNKDFEKAKLLFPINKPSEFVDNMKKIEKHNMLLYKELELVITTNKLDTLQILLDGNILSFYDDDVENKSKLLDCAIARSNADIILLLRNGVKINSRQSLNIAVCKLEPHVFHMLLENTAYPDLYSTCCENLMLVAMNLCKKEHMKILLDKGVKIMDIIFCSIRSTAYSFEMTQLLIENNIDRIESIVDHIFNTDSNLIIPHKKLLTIDLIFNLGAEIKREYIGISNDVDNILIKYSHEDLYQFFDQKILVNVPCKIKSARK